MVAPRESRGVLDIIARDYSANKYGRFILLEAGVGISLHTASRVTRNLGMSAIANIAEAAAIACTVPLAVDAIRFASASSHAVAQTGLVSDN